MPHGVVRWTVLGPIRAWRDEAEIDLAPPQQRVLLGLLIAQAGRPLPPDRIVAALWDTHPPATAANAVRRYVGALRRLFEPGLPAREPGRYLQRSLGGYVLRADTDATDLLRFRSLAGRARAVSDPTRAMPLFLDALHEWQGPAGGGLRHPIFHELDRERLSVVREAAEAAVASGQTGLLVTRLRTAAERHPYDAVAQAALIQVLARAGRRAEAGERYAAVSSRLDGDLGPEVRAAVARTATAGLPAQLPADLPAFTARASELAFVPGDASAVVVTGPAGIGKSAFAVHWAHRVAGSFLDGQLYASLADRDTAGVLRRFLSGLGERVPADDAELAARYRDATTGRRVLVLLDDARDADQVRPLLPGPGGFAIVTSRDPLHALTDSAARPRATRPGPIEPSPAESRPEPVEPGRIDVGRIDVERIELGPLDDAEARAMLVGRLGENLVATEADAVAAVIKACGGRPRDLADIAARAATSLRPSLVGLA